MNKLRQEATKYIEKNLNRISPLGLNEDEKATVINRMIQRLIDTGHNSNCARSTLYRYAKEAIHEIIDLKTNLSRV